MDDIPPPAPILEVAFGTLGLIAIIFVHGASLRVINRRFSAGWVRWSPWGPGWRINLLLASVIGALTLVHLTETLLWAVPLSWMGIIPGMRDSYYYVLESYTTLGEGNVTLPERWRLLGPIIAMSGVFTFGWTGSVLVSIMTEFGRLDRTSATRERSGEKETWRDP